MGRCSQEAEFRIGEGKHFLPGSLPEVQWVAGLEGEGHVCFLFGGIQTKARGPLRGGHRQDFCLDELDQWVPEVQALFLACSISSYLKLAGEGWWGHTAKVWGWMAPCLLVGPSCSSLLSPSELSELVCFGH